MQVTRNVLFVLASAVGALAAAGSAAPAWSQTAEYQGGWLEQGANCADVYAGGRAPSFKSGLSGFTRAFIVSGRTLRTPLAKCAIGSKTTVGDRRVFKLSCTNAVATDDVTLIVSPRAGDTLQRYTSTADRTGSTYKRCGTASPGDAKKRADAQR